MKNIVYFDGPHGSGKSTLINKLKELNPGYLIVEKLPITKLEDPLDRSKLRLARHYLHAVSHYKLAEENKNKVILSDRSYLDSILYPEAFFNLGWISKKQYEANRNLVSLLFDEKYKPENIVILNPTIEELISNIQKRWERKKKWREENIEYLIAVKNAYQKYAQNNQDVLLLNIMDLDERLRITSEWINERIIKQHINKKFKQEDHAVLAL